LASGPQWRFRVELGEPLDPRAVLEDRIKVFAVDRRGSRSELQINGAVQLGFLRDAYAKPSEVEVEIDFTQGGNSTDFVQKGWSGQEPTHTWTDGDQSLLRLPFTEPGASYVGEILAWPFTVPDRIPGQTVLVSIEDTLLTTFHVTPGQNLLEFQIPSALTMPGQAVVVMKFLDAARPSDLMLSSDSRLVALAFRRLRLKRLLVQAVDGDGPLTA
jgi:hypothetical protein